jgi:imidazolonepropionase-like amidohydrolase
LACSGEQRANATQSSDVLLITNVTIVDGSEAPPLENAAILIRGNRITSVGPTGRISVPENARVYNGSGEYVIPGLCRTASFGFSLSMA